MYMYAVVTSCAAGDLLINSKCYRKLFAGPQSWYLASNDCLSHDGSLAVFTNIRRPSDDGNLKKWLLNSTSDRACWIGLVRSWWKTTDKGAC